MILLSIDQYNAYTKRPLKWESSSIVVSLNLIVIKNTNFLLPYRLRILIDEIFYIYLSILPNLLTKQFIVTICPELKNKN